MTKHYIHLPAVKKIKAKQCSEKTETYHDENKSYKEISIYKSKKVNNSKTFNIFLNIKDF